MLGEFELIEKYLVPLAENPCSMGLSDDVAIVQPPTDHELVFTKDLLMSGVHFFQEDPPGSIAKKALRVNVSDIIAKGAEPMGYMMGLGLPGNWTEDWMRAFCNGLQEDQKFYGLELYGGDLVGSPQGLGISITMIGKVPAGQAVKRSSACAGDSLYVTGTIGDSTLGLLARNGGLPNLPEEHLQKLINRYLLPEPPIKAVGLIRNYSSASMDISDGLVADLEHLCNSSGVGAVICAQNVPVSEESRAVLDADSQRLRDILSGGDDYQALLCVSGSELSEFERRAETDGVMISRIGRVHPEPGVRIENSDGSSFEIGMTGHDHFRKSAEKNATDKSA